MYLLKYNEIEQRTQTHFSEGLSMALKNGVPHSKDLKEGRQPGKDEFEQR